MTRPSAGRRDFSTTHWSVVLAAGGRDTARAREALERLCRIYWYPLYAYLRRRGHATEDAQDLIQGFFTRLLETRGLETVAPERGRFRSFLIAALNHFVSNRRDWDRAQKRGGGQRLLPIELETAEGRYQLEPPDPTTPEVLFERRWALTLLERILGGLRDEMTRAGKERLFDALKIYLTGEMPEQSYAEAGTALGLSEGAVKVAVHRLRRRYRDLLREEIAQTVSTADEVDDEIRYLWAALAR